MKNTIKSLVLLAIFASQTFAENIYHSQNEEFLNGITIDKEINFTGTTDDVIINNQSLQEYLNDAGGIKIKGMTSPEAQSETTFDHVSGIRFDNESGFTISSNNDGFINVEMNSAWTELVPDFPNQEYGNLKPQGEEKLSIKVVESDTPGTYWDYTETNKNQKTFYIGIPTYATTNWVKEQDELVEKNVSQFSPTKSITIDFADGNAQYFKREDLVDTTILLSLPNSNIDKFGKLTLYVDEMSDYNFWYDFNNTNIIDLLLEKPWITYENDSLWEFEFVSPPSMTDWIFKKAERLKDFPILITRIYYLDGSISKTNVTSLTTSVFSDINNVKSIIIGNNVTSISSTLFKNNTHLENVIFNNKNDIPYQSFYGCTNLKSVIIGNNINNIGQYAFRGCNHLNDVEIGNNVISIENGAFYGCSFSNIKIPSSITTIYNDAFSQCNNLKTVNIDDLSSWYNITFNNMYASPLCYNAKLYVNGEELFGELLVPDNITKINDYTFCNYTNLTSIIIPNSVTPIGMNSFGNCSSVTNVSLSNGIQSISDSAFAGCKNLSTINLPNTLLSIEQSAFADCAITNIIIPDSITRIEQNTFARSGLQTITIPDSVTFIGGGAIGNGAFDSCTNMTSITIGSNVTIIKKYAFNYCPNLTTINYTLRSEQTAEERKQELITLLTSSNFNTSQITTWNPISNL